jgi:hypothetical protein
MPRRDRSPSDRANLAAASGFSHVFNYSDLGALRRRRRSHSRSRFASIRWTRISFHFDEYFAAGSLMQSITSFSVFRECIHGLLDQYNEPR